MKIKVISYKAVAAWNWKNIPESTCSICQLAFESCCQHCIVPGPSCPPTKAPNCNHWFHLHCAESWIKEKLTEEQKVCPNCRAPWTPQQPQPPQQQLQQQDDDGGDDSQQQDGNE